MKKTSMFRNILVLAAIIALLVVASTAMADAAVVKPAVVTKLSLISPVSGSIEVGQTQTVKWSTVGTKVPTVSVRLIKKVGSNPNRYEAVRTISASTANDGSATWVPAITDAGPNLSLEIGCTPSKVACQAGNSTGKTLAVINSTRYMNTASVFQAIEAVNNK